MDFIEIHKLKKKKQETSGNLEIYVAKVASITKVLE